MFTFEVEGMTCQNCVKHITKAIHEIEPAAEVTVDLNRHTVTVKQTQQSQAALTTCIEETGYSVRQVTVLD